MIQLFNGCYCSELAVHPKNWNEKGASCAQNWYIYYRFYDPTYINSKGKPIRKLIVIKGMNIFTTLAERREITADLIKDELHRLQVEGLNPIQKIYMVVQEPEVIFEVDPDTPLTKALSFAIEKLIVVHEVKLEMKNIVKKVEKAAKILRLEALTISKVTRRHMKVLIEQCGKESKNFSNHRYNLYRGYLMMMFKELVELEACLVNPIRDISKKPVTKKIKDVLTPKQRIDVDQHLKKVFPEFREFVHLFFHSGGRKTEIFQLKPDMVDLKKQKYRCIVKKRRQYEEVERTIKTIAIPHWEYFLKNCPADHFLFGTLFKPGLEPMGKGMPTTYWNKYIKNEETGLGIKIDFYALKYLNTTEVVDQLDEKDAAALNAHTSEAMVRSIYDVGQKGRQHDRLKKVNNKFA